MTAIHAARAPEMKPATREDVRGQLWTPRHQGERERRSVSPGQLVPLVSAGSESGQERCRALFGIDGMTSVEGGLTLCGEGGTAEVSGAVWCRSDARGDGPAVDSWTAGCEGGGTVVITATACSSLWFCLRPSGREE